LISLLNLYDILIIDMTLLHKKPSYSLVFALVLMTGIMIVASTSMDNSIEKVRFYNDMEGNTQARLASESAVERAYLEIKQYELGYEPVPSEEEFCVKLRVASIPDDGAEGEEESDRGLLADLEYEVDCSGELSRNRHTVRARSEENPLDLEGNYYLPLPNAGTAAPQDECPLGRDIYKDPSHACNWNKLLYGDVVTIPLYSADASGAFNPFVDEAPFADWSLKMRLPCINGSLDQYCGGGDRYLLDDGDGSIDQDQSVILWKLIGERADGSKVELGLSDMKAFIDPSARDILLNTEVIESDINDELFLNENLVLRMSDYIEIMLFSQDSDFIKLSLQLEPVLPFITKPELFEPVLAPYLEWQLITNTPVASNRVILEGEGWYEGRHNTYYFPYTSIIETSEGGFTGFTLAY
jgi:hypothetical protein